MGPGFLGCPVLQFTALLLCLTCRTLCRCFLLGTALGGGQRLLLGTLLTRLGFGYATGILAGCGLSSSLPARQFFGTLLGGSLGGLPLGLGGLAFSLSLGTGLRPCYLFGNEFLNLGIQCGVLLALLADEVFNGLLFFLQCADHFLLLGLLVLQLPVSLLVTCQQFALLSFADIQFVLGQQHFFLDSLNSLALCPLELCVFACEAYTAEHLSEILGTEDEHELVLQGLRPVHVAY